MTIRTTGIPLLAPLVPPPGVPLPPVAPIAAAIAPILLSIAPTPDLIPVLAALNAFADPAAVVNAVAQLGPSAPDLAAPLVTFQGSRQFQNLWLSRLDEVLCTQVREPDDKRSNCRDEAPHTGWWGKGFAYFGAQGSKDSFVGYDSRILGTMIGYDVPLDRDTRVGIGVGYARTDIDGKTFDAGSASTDFNTYKATAYIGHERGPWYVHGEASFGWNAYSGTRHIAFTGVDRKAEADYNGQDYTAFATTGYHFFTNGFTITPLASLQYTHVNVDGYTETGAGDVNLKVQSQSFDFLESGLGVKVARAFRWRGGTYLPEAHVKWLHEINNPALEKTAAFTAATGLPFTTPGLRTADDTFNVGAGLTLLSCDCAEKSWSVEAVYDYEWRTDSYSAHRGLVRYAARF